MKNKTNVSDIFRDMTMENKYLKICAPMVRYSKIQFRTLVRHYGVDMCFTPMIMADSFCQNAKARENEFSTTTKDTPLIVQFAANNASDFTDASNLVYPYADGVDLNCGCPQRWAMTDGYGCALLKTPQVIFDIVKSVKNSVPSDFSISVKIRIVDDLKRTIDMCRQMEMCGVTFLTVHGRTPSQKSGDNVNVDALKEVCSSVKVPLVANGGIKTLEESNMFQQQIKCNGVMVANGLLTNPALFSGAVQTPIECVWKWIDLKNHHPDRITFQCYHHHLVFMLEKVLSKEQKQVFNHLNSFSSVDKYLFENFIQDKSYICVRTDEFIHCKYSDNILNKHSNKCRGCGKSAYYCVCLTKYDSNVSNGKFYDSFVDQTLSDIDYNFSNLFIEN